MHKLSFKKDAKIGIVGAGIEGICSAKFLKHSGYENITVLDENPDLVQEEELAYIKGEGAFGKLSEFDVIVRSPGIPKHKLDIGNAILTSATKIFFEACPCKIIGITGTKGKGTTSTLIYRILKKAGKDVYLGGNIGNCALEFVDKLKAGSWVVLELSSFQLHDLEMSPHISVILNTTSEHLDYHVDLEDYLSAKESIVKFQAEKDLVITNKDYPYADRYLKLSKAEKMFVSVNEKIENGASLKGDDIVFGEEFIVGKSEAGLMGPHNLENILPAVIVGKYLKIENDVIAQEIKDFKGLEHRLELVGVHPKLPIRFINDSFSTTPETCMAAINSIPDSDNLILIAGGSEKHSDYSELGEMISHSSYSYIKTLVLMGDTAKRIESEIKREGLEIIHAEDGNDAFEKAFEAAKKLAIMDEKAVVVLLSPASASFGLFKNYKERGNKFREFAQKI